MARIDAGSRFGQNPDSEILSMETDYHELRIGLEEHSCEIRTRDQVFREIGYSNQAAVAAARAKWEAFYASSGTS